jgi:adenylate cyclase
VPEGRIQAIRFASSLPTVGADEKALVEDDATVVRDFETGGGAVRNGAGPALHAAPRESLARMAEAAISLVLVHFEAPIRAAGASQLELAKARFRSVESSRPLVIAVGKLFRAHLDVAGRRMRAALADGGSVTARLSVGFVDMVGFTTLARRTEPGALARIIERFEDTAYDVAASRGGQVVKFVGDEVMFVASEPLTACDIALTLVERFADDASVTPRGGLAHGDVLLRGGDYYGPIVNLAARLVEHAVPNEVLVMAAVGEVAGEGDVRFESAGRRIVKGFDDPVMVLTATRPPR